MTWGEIQIESLKKMFLNKEILEISKLEEYKKDKKYKTYLDAMPQACNEAINYILSQEPIINVFRLEKTSTNAKYDLKKLITNYKSFHNIVSENFIKWNMLTKNILEVNCWDTGTIDIYYESYLEPIKRNTSNNEEIELDNEFVRILPLYIAGELYKDDDLALSTMYMNEFLENLGINIKNANAVNNTIRTTYGMEW